MSDPQQDEVAGPHPLDWMLIGRYALLVALCDLIPVPLLDFWVENVLRRRMVRAIGLAHGVPLDADAQKQLGNKPFYGCSGCLVAIVVWPVKKLLKTISVVFQVKGIADTFTEVVHRALLLEEAFEAGWLPGDPERVRIAMDAALDHVDTRVVERTLRGTMRDVRHELSRTVTESVRITRERLASRPAEALADAAEADGLGPGADEASRVMVASLKSSALVPELVTWFRAEMGQAPRVESKLAGPIEPELVAGDVPEAPPRALPAPIEEAEELAPPDVTPRSHEE